MKNVVTIVLVLTLVSVVFLVIKNRKKTKGGSEEVVCPDFKSKYEDKDAVTNSENPDMEKQVVLGDYGNEVSYLQERLNSQYGAGIIVDGKFGCETHFAVAALTGLDSESGIDLNDLK
jgi:hypothetical protein